MDAAGGTRTSFASGTPADRLRAQGYLVLDGGLATELERRGADLRDPLWSARVLLDQPELIREVHQAYFAAGADVAITASYQASLDGLRRRGLTGSEARRAIGSSVWLAAEARERFLDQDPGPLLRVRPLIAGSVGPYGASLVDGSEYHGGYRISPSQLEDFHGPRLEALVDAGPDLIAIETMPSAAEAAVVLRLLEAWSEPMAWVSFTARDPGLVGNGEPVTTAVSAVAGHPRVLAVGFNCVAPEFARDLLHSARTVTAKPLVVYPNSGEHWDPVHRRWTGDGSREDFGMLARAWHTGGARLIGGCCRTTPDTVRAIRDALATRDLDPGGTR